MKKNLFEVIAETIGSAESVTTRRGTFTDSYFNSGFTCEYLVINFSFHSDADRNNYKAIVKGLNRNKKLSITFQNASYHGAALEILKASDAEPYKAIRDAQSAAAEDFANIRHTLIISGLTEAEQKPILDEIHADNVKRFLQVFQGIRKAA